MIVLLAKLGRLLRPLRLMRTLAVFDTLHVLVWSCGLLLLIMMTLSIFLESALEPFTMDLVNEGSRGSRETAFQYFGTFSRSFVTMFELTFGNWVIVCRFLSEDISEWYGPCVLIYRFVVGFAVCTVIRGVFLHETFKVAQSDDHLMIIQKEREMRKNVRKMQTLFSEADDSGDGFLCRAEFQAIMQDRRVLSWLAALDLEVRDAEVLFDLMDDGDHRISAEELVYGFSRLKGPARNMDVAVLMNEIRRIKHVTKNVLDKVDVLQPRHLSTP